MVFPTEPITPSENSDALFSKPLVTFSECCCFQLLCLVGLFPLPGTPRQAWYQADRSSSAWHLLGVKFGNIFIQWQKNMGLFFSFLKRPSCWKHSSPWTIWESQNQSIFMMLDKFSSKIEENHESRISQSKDWFILTFIMLQCLR